MPDPTPATRGGRMRPTLAFAALAVLFFALLLPAHPADFVAASFLRLPLELPLVVLALLALGRAPAGDEEGRRARSAARVLRALVTALIGALLLLRLADIGSYLAFDRRFSPLVELHLLRDGWNLASASVGRLEAGIVVALALGVFALLCALLYHGLGAVPRLARPTRRALGGVSTTALVGGAVVLAASHAGERETAVQADLLPDIVDRVAYVQRSIADQRDFALALADDPLAAGPPPAFDALAGRDVMLLFVESYGRSFLDDEGFREAARERLAALGETLARAGLHARSAWLTSPIRGGRSWLAHASVASGLPIENQARFDRLIASSRPSLNRLFGRAGWHTAGLMPAIVESWPEGEWYGFDETLMAADLDYRGEPFGWVTMPDQYTLAAFERLVRNPSEKPVMAEIALISSHAPWTPLPTAVLPWESIGDGAVFDGKHREGPPAEQVWRDRTLVRERYALSLDYTLRVIGEYLERHGENALVLVLGDHQPASIIAGWGETADVPVHVVADDRALLARLDGPEWTDGMVPADTAPSLPMQALRGTLASRFGAEPPSPGEARVRVPPASAGEADGDGAPIRP